MKSYTYSEARQRLAALLDQARREGAVEIRRRDGTTFVLRPVLCEGSPLDVPGVPTALRRGELVEIIREERAGSGSRVLETLRRPSMNRPAPKKGRKPRSEGKSRRG